MSTNEYQQHMFSARLIKLNMYGQSLPRTIAKKCSFYISFFFLA